MNTVNKAYSEQLEKMIDTITLPQVLELLSEICIEKAQHLRENWQDKNAARIWEKNAALLDKTYPRIYS